MTNISKIYVYPRQGHLRSPALSRASAHTPGMWLSMDLKTGLPQRHLPPPGALPRRLTLFTTDLLPRVVHSVFFFSFCLQLLILHMNTSNQLFPNFWSSKIIPIKVINDHHHNETSG